MVEVRQASDQFGPDLPEEVLQVDKFPAYEDEADDEEWDLTVS